MRNSYYYGKHFIDQKDINAVKKCLFSNSISQGNELKRLEENVARYCGAKYCVAVSSGTAGLHMAVLSLDLPKKFKGLTTPITFAGTVNSMILSGGEFNLIDIDKRSFNLDTNELTKKLENKKKFADLIIPVHFAGQSANMEKIYSLSKKYGIKIIEDASQAMGGLYKGKKIGSCKYSDLTVSSLHPVKTITSGEGGLILTNNKKIYSRLLDLRMNGIRKTNKPTWEQDIHFPGLNYKISELNCALANSQMSKIDKFVNLRKNISKFYNQNLNQNIFELPKIMSENISAWHLYVVKIKKKIKKKTKDNFFKKLRKMNINLDVKYKPIQKFKFYKKNFNLNTCKKSEDFFNQSFCLPIYPSLNKKDLQYICKNINQVAIKMKI